MKLHSTDLLRDYTVLTICFWSKAAKIHSVLSENTYKHSETW